MSKEFLLTKVIPNPLETIETAPLTANVMELAHLLLDTAGEKTRNSRWAVSLVEGRGARYQRIFELLGDKQWNDPDNYQLLIFLLGDEKASYMLRAWEQAPVQMYQEGYARRSYRAPNNPHAYQRNQINNLIHILPQAYIKAHNENYDYVATFYDLSIVEQICYNQFMVHQNPQIFRLWSAAIDMGNSEVFEVLEAIIYNKDAVGKVTPNIIKALLNSNKPEAWKLVEQLLLSAQRQEGLRQTILESLDETSIGAMKHLIRVIVDNDLVRFSSVLRAIDVWVGMGWDTEKESAVKKFLELGIEYLEKPELIPSAVQSDNNAEVFMALWAQGVFDVYKTVPYLQQLYKEGDVQKRSLALIFANKTWLKDISMPLEISALTDTDLLPVAIAVNDLYSWLAVRDHAAFYNQQFPALFDQLHDLYKRTTVKEKTFEGVIFSWLKISFSSKTIMHALITLVGQDQHRLDTLIGYMDEMDSVMRRFLTIRILPEYTGQNAHDFKRGNKVNLTPFQHRYAMLIVKDKSEFDTACDVLYHTQFTTEELSSFPVLLKRKAAEFRGSIIQLLLRQKDASLIPVMQEVLTGDAEQRMAGLDMLIQLKKQKRLLNERATWVDAFNARKSISSKEQILLQQLGGSPVKDVSDENGYGLYDPKQIAPIVSPVIDPDNVYEKMLAKHPYAFSMPIETIKAAIADLCDIFDLHKETEYEVEDEDNSRTKYLLGNVFQVKNRFRKYTSNEEEYNTYPLPELWKSWYEKWALTPLDLFLLTESFESPSNAYINMVAKQLPQVEEFVPARYAKINRYNNPILFVLYALTIIKPVEQQEEFLLGAATRSFALLDDKLLARGAETKDWRMGWQNMAGVTVFLKQVAVEKLSNELMRKAWNLCHWKQFTGLKENIPHNLPHLMIFVRAYEAGIIGDADMLRAVMHPDHMQKLTFRNKKQFDYIAYFPFLNSFLDRARNHVLDIELKRGDLPTSVTAIAGEIHIVPGVNRFAEIIAGLGKTTLDRGYSWSGDGASKSSSFSDLLRVCVALTTDTQEQFNAAMKHIKASDQRLLEAAMYAPQWQGFVSNYLGWKGLNSAIWWMHAHTKTSAYQQVDTVVESQIALYSTLDVEEFKNGAVDKEWFVKAYEEIGAEHWPLVYDAAKYISDGNGHRRARIYADVLLGVLTLKEVTEKITTKRDQDYLRIYGLAPLKKSAEILERYEFLQQFKKESKQFGAQKQSSEALSIQISMENLARNAGYPDPIRLTWAMETKQIQEIFAKETQVQFDDVLIGLVIDEDGEADVVSFKGDKQLKDIPSKYRKDKKVEELNGFKKTLREQLRRSRAGLEDAMVRGDVFLMTEIQALSEHPVIVKHLSKLVFISSDRKYGFYRDGMLIDGDGSSVALAANDELRIAHCTDLYSTGSWAAFQRYAFDNKLQQPFKQIFRELYLVTEDERQEVSVSRRYAGHQVQPKQTLALLRTRGWKTNFEEGLQKVYHKEGFAARMYAMADWFSPADVESPTLETVVFVDLKTYKNVPFETIHPRIFSEVMRDIDLVVSIAHVGGVDPEASHSSIEMRTVLLQETIRLFKLDNVTVKGSHALIKGTMGEYNVHLGSAVVHSMSSGYLSILPVHSQHRGRLFLPFVDDDPRSAELISKVLLLARDQEIQDPTILRQLN